MFCISWQHPNHPNLLICAIYRLHVYFHVRLILHKLGISLPHEDGFSKVKNAYMTDLERSSLDNAQYLRRDMIEISPVPLELSNNELEGLVCKVLSLTGNEVYPDDLEACRRLKKKRKCHHQIQSRKLKYNVINNRKAMKNKSKELNELKLSNNLYISESMCAGNHSLFFKCRKLKKARKIFNTWFFNNAINVQLNQNGEIHKVFHTEDLAALLKVDDLDSFLMNL